MHNIVIVGFGEIARKAHRPAIDERDDCQILAIVDIVDNNAAKIPTYRSLQEAYKNHPTINAASICTPQALTLDYAFEAVHLGLNCLLEKPPGDYTRLPALVELAAAKKVTIYTAYHSTVPPGIGYIHEWINRQHNGSGIKEIFIEWKESARKWHPNQEWITTREGMGVLDPVFNPISLLVSILEKQSPIEFRLATLVRPQNCGAPISGTLALVSKSSNDTNIPITAEFALDYEPTTSNVPEEIWNITFTGNDNSVLKTTDGGAQVYVDGERKTMKPTAEYQLGPEYVNLYDKFVALIEKGLSYSDDTTPRIIQKVLDNAKWIDGDPYDIMIPNS